MIIIIIIIIIINSSRLLFIFFLEDTYYTCTDFSEINLSHFTVMTRTVYTSLHIDKISYRFLSRPMLMIYPGKKFHMPSSSAPVVIAIKPKA
jgi:hypothetical protein